MEPDILFPSLSVTIGLSFAALIVFIIAAVQEGRHGSSTADIVRRGYLYLVSFVTLLIASAAFVSLLDTGLRAWVFTKADAVPAYRSLPPGLYVTPAPSEKESSGLACTNGCTLSAEQKEQIANWETQYRDWRSSTNPSTARSQAVVTAISFLIIAGIVYLLHWMLATRDVRRSKATAMRITHLWSVSFIMLIVSVITAAFLLNTGLRALLLKDAVSNTVNQQTPVAAERSGVDSITTCGNACGLSSDTVQLAKDWQADYAAHQQRFTEQRAVRDRHNTFAREIAFLLVALPLFAYHFKTVWRETRSGEGKTESVPSS